MLEIETLDTATVNQIRDAGRAAFRRVCVCTYACECAAGAIHRSKSDGSEARLPDWLIHYVAADREIPYAWAAATFDHLARSDAYGARLRGYLLSEGTDCLRFGPPPPPPVYRVLLDVSALGNGAAWDAWCDDPAAALLDDGIEPQGMRDAYDAWDVSGATSEEDARARIAPHLHSGVTIHTVTER